jgi:citrate lyase subunit beta/citryl-CoA lyase
VTRARKIIDAFARARADGQGVATVGGRMIENLDVDNARRILALADAIATRGRPGAPVGDQP